MMTMRKTGKSGLAGFTAIEIAMVATVIAILALIILPLFRKRTEQARLVAARDDMLSIAKAQILANADTDRYFRLQDLDNTVNYNDPPLDPATEVPVAEWNWPLTDIERVTLAQPERWQGPYYSVQSYTNLANLILARPELVRLYPNDGGPILYFQDANIQDDLNDDKLPIDPWGNPYIFFGPGQLRVDPANETDYGNAVVYSLGPDGLPGDGTADPLDPQNYKRERGILGSGDDLKLEF